MFPSLLNLVFDSEGIKCVTAEKYFWEDSRKNFMLTIFERIQSMWNTALEATLRGTIVSGTLPCRYQLIYTHVQSVSSISKIIK